MCAVTTRRSNDSQISVFIKNKDIVTKPTAKVFVISVPICHMTVENTHLY